MLLMNLNIEGNTTHSNNKKSPTVPVKNYCSRISFIINKICFLFQSTNIQENPPTCIWFFEIPPTFLLILIKMPIVAKNKETNMMLHLFVWNIKINYMLHRKMQNKINKFSQEKMFMFTFTQRQHLYYQFQRSLLISCLGK